MAGKPRKIPSYLRHKASGRGYALFQGRRGPPTYFPGPWNSEESWAAYHRAVAEWQAGRTPGQARPQADGVEVRYLVASWWAHAEAQRLYHKGGKKTDEWAVIHAALKRLLKPYKGTMTGQLRWDQLETLRAGMLLDELAPRTIDHYLGRVRSLFRWGEAKGMVPKGHTAAELVPQQGLGTGKPQSSRAEKYGTVPPVDAFDVGCVCLVAPPEVRAMLLAQRYKAIRPSGVCLMRRSDFDFGPFAGPFAGLWRYREPVELASKKGTEAHLIGPRLQAILRPFLVAAARPGDFLFRPSRRPRAVKSGHYNADTYRVAVGRLCARVGVEPFAPNQVRHRALTDVRHRYGAEAARVWGDHDRLETTEIYAERDETLAARIAREFS
jgi:integrase